MQDVKDVIKELKIIVINNGGGNKICQDQHMT